MGKFFSFDGRIGRADYWMITVLGYGAMFGSWLVMLFASALAESAEEGLSALFALGGILLLLGTSIAVTIVSLATSAKRWHDRDKSGWWILITLIPFVGVLWAAIELGFLEGTNGPNHFGSKDSGSPLSRQRVAPAAYPVTAPQGWEAAR